jgi:hypothetical protein
LWFSCTTIHVLRGSSGPPQGVLVAFPLLSPGLGALAFLAPFESRFTLFPCGEGRRGLYLLLVCPTRPMRARLGRLNRESSAIAGV